MARARGKYSQAISDRSGVAFPYKEMVKEWNGSLVHKSEFERKHPQLELRTRGRKVRVSGFKKAIVTIKKGQNIDLTLGI